MKVIRGVFGVAEVVAPGLAGRAAFELFCRTPGPRALTAGERRAIDRATPFMADARHHRLQTGGGCVAVHEFRPEPGVEPAGRVLVIHGWRSRTEYMQTLVDGFRRAGFRVYALDLPGHGHSAGRRLHMGLAVDAVRAAAEWFGPFAAVVGHSFGGAVAVSALTGAIAGIPPLPTGRLVLIATPNSMPAVFDGFGRMVNLGPRSRMAIADQVRRVAGRPLDHFVGADLLSRIDTPTLVMHAPDDREVAADDAEALGRAGPHVRLHWAPGLGHRRILSDAGVVAEAVGFVEGREAAVLH